MKAQMKHWLATVEVRRQRKEAERKAALGARGDAPGDAPGNPLLTVVPVPEVDPTVVVVPPEVLDLEKMCLFTFRI